jgi:hypothetical protein
MRISPETFLSGVALLVMGISLSEIEHELGVKSETLRRHLDQFLTAEGRWGYLEFELSERFSLPVDYLVNFGMAVEKWIGDGKKTALFRVWGQCIRRGTGLELDKVSAWKLKKKILKNVHRPK